MDENNSEAGVTAVSKRVSLLPGGVDMFPDFELTLSVPCRGNVLDSYFHPANGTGRK